MSDIDLIGIPRRKSGEYLLGLNRNFKKLAKILIMP